MKTPMNLTAPILTLCGALASASPVWGETAAEQAHQYALAQLGRTYFSLGELRVRLAALSQALDGRESEPFAQLQEGFTALEASLDSGLSNHRDAALVRREATRALSGLAMLRSRVSRLRHTLPADARAAHQAASALGEEIERISAEVGGEQPICVAPAGDGA
jgi:hypothetical protein